MNKLIILFFAVYTQTFAFSQTGILVPEMTQADNLVNNFMSLYGIPAASVAMANNGKLVYQRSFGKSDIAGTLTTQPYNLFSI